MIEVEIQGELPTPQDIAEKVMEDMRRMQKYKYRLRVIPTEFVGDGEFEAPAGWVMFDMVVIDGKLYAIFESAVDC